MEPGLANGIDESDNVGDSGAVASSSPSTPSLLSLACERFACYFPHSYRCLSSFWNAVRPRLTHSHGHHPSEPLSMVSQGWLHVDSCASVATPGLCVRRAGSDLNPNHFLVSLLFYSIDSIAVMSPTFRLAPACWFTFVNCLARCAKGRLEVREWKL